jgi:hypothetical protein
MRLAVWSFFTVLFVATAVAIPRDNNQYPLELRATIPKLKASDAVEIVGFLARYWPNVVGCEKADWWSETPQSHVRFELNAGIYTLNDILEKLSVVIPNFKWAVTGKYVIVKIGNWPKRADSSLELRTTRDEVITVDGHNFLLWLNYRDPSPLFPSVEVLGVEPDEFVSIKVKSGMRMVDILNSYAEATGSYWVASIADKPRLYKVDKSNEFVNGSQVGLQLILKN